jgi:hypothetical protein
METLEDAEALTVTEYVELAVFELVSVALMVTL